MRKNTKAAVAAPEVVDTSGLVEVALVYGGQTGHVTPDKAAQLVRDGEARYCGPAFVEAAEEGPAPLAEITPEQTVEALQAAGFGPVAEAEAADAHETDDAAQAEPELALEPAAPSAAEA